MPTAAPSIQTLLTRGLLIPCLQETSSQPRNVVKFSTVHRIKFSRITGMGLHTQKFFVNFPKEEERERKKKKTLLLS